MAWARCRTWAFDVQHGPIFEFQGDRVDAPPAVSRYRPAGPAARRGRPVLANHADVDRELVPALRRHALCSAFRATPPRFASRLSHALRAFESPSCRDRGRFLAPRQGTEASPRGPPFSRERFRPAG